MSQRKKITREVRKYFQMNKNENITHQKFQNSANVMFGGNFIAMNAYIKGKKNFRITA